MLIPPTAGLRFCVGFCLVLERYLLFLRWLVEGFRFKGSGCWRLAAAESFLTLRFIAYRRTPVICIQLG